MHSLRQKLYRTINCFKNSYSIIDGKVLKLSTEKFSCYQRKIYL
nr:hypothetical protein [Streptococcus mutans]